MQIPRWPTDKGSGWLVVAALLGLLGLTHPAHATEFSCAAGDVACLISAIHAANVTGTANTITLAAGLYALTAVDNNTDGPNGLPSVTGSLSITGAGADTTILERAAEAPLFRLLHVADSGTLTLEGLTLQGGDVAGVPISPPFNVANNTGGGVRNRGTLTVTHSLLRNHAASNGGGIDSLGTLLITHSTLRSNTASGSPASGGGSGGGIRHIQGRSLTITDSTLSSNFAVGSGGGIYVITAFGASITNSTLHGNTAGGEGGGIFLPGFTLRMTNSTVSGNLAGQGGGISAIKAPSRIPAGQAILQNTILARNTVLPAGAGPDCVTILGGQVTSLGHNLIGNPTGCIISLVPSDLTGDPGLGDFTDDGTPGQGYLPLLPTSQAIDAGDPAACPATDQLGQLRLTPCDIGAVEFAPVTLTLGLNQATVHAGQTLRVALGIHNLGPSVTADAYLGVLLPDGVSVLFVTTLFPLDGVVTRLDADPRTFAPLAASYEFPPGLEVTVEDFFVYTITGEEASGSYTIFTLLTPPGAFADGQVDAGDLLALTLQPFTVSP